LGRNRSVGATWPGGVSPGDKRVTSGRSISVSELILREEAEVTTGPFGTQFKASEYVESGVPMLNVRNLGFGDIRMNSLEFLSDETAARLLKHQLAPGDIVFGRKGAVERHAFISSREDGWVQGSDCLRLRLNSLLLVPRYVSYFLLTEFHKEWMKNHCSGATTMASLNQDIVGRIEIPLAPISHQRKIVEVLSAYDELIENNSRRIEILEEMAQAIYREWFVEFRYPGHEDVPLVDSELGPIPEGWEVGSLQDLVTTQYGYTESAVREPVGPRFLRGMDINKTSFIEWAEVPFCPIDEAGLQKFRLEKGDILVIRMADPGKVGMVERDIDAVFASYLVRLRPVNVDVTKPYFLFFSLLGDRYQGFVGGASSGTTRQSISAKAMTEFSIPLPTVEVQTAFEEVVIPIRELMSSLVEANRNLRETRDLLLPRLISGEIDVSELDIELAGSSV
jgi:type I restriction enzyme S subunit